jgi:CubicO group peptidase (beta-lactamase class C family)
MLKRVLYIIECIWLISGYAYAQDQPAKLSALFDTLYAHKSFNGCVLVSGQGKVIFQNAYGLADVDTKRLLTTESIFELASVSKGFTAMGIMQLKEKKLLSYDDSIRKFFPELPYSGVSILNLLTHTSGIPDFLGWTEEDVDVRSINSNSEIIRVLPLKYPSTKFKPGSTFLYSNTNYILLSSIIEKVSGLSFSEFMGKNIFLPCGMSNTSVFQRFSNALPKDYALDYIWDGSENHFSRADSLKRYTYFMSGVTGAYGISSNLTDLYKWDNALTSALLVSDSTMKEAFSPIKLKGSNNNIEIEPGIPYVFGWQLLPNNDMFGSGSFGGYTSLIVRELSKKQTIILLSNFIETSDVMSIMNNIEEILEGESLTRPDLKKPQMGVKLPLDKLQAYQGTYMAKDGSFPQMKIKCIGNKLYAKVGDSMEQNIFAKSEDIFFIGNINAKLVFNKDSLGKVISITLDGLGISHTLALKE